MSPYQSGDMYKMKDSSGNDVFLKGDNKTLALKYLDNYLETKDPMWLQKQKELADNVGKGFNTGALGVLDQTEYTTDRDIYKDATGAYDELTTTILTDYNNKKDIPLNQGFGLTGGGGLQGNVLIFKNTDAAKPLGGKMRNARQDISAFANNLNSVGTEIGRAHV